jgi:four helix bundle protein
LSSGHLVIWLIGHWSWSLKGLLDGMIGERLEGMSDFSELLKERTMTFAQAVLRLVDTLPHTPGGRVVANQLANAATSVASNYRASCNARSRREFIAKLGLVVEEADEAEFWLDLIRRAKMLPDSEVVSLARESVELRNIFGKSVGTARANVRAEQHRKNDQLTR